MVERATAPGLELTPRERDVVRLMAAGRTNGEIAEALGITFATAKWHVSAIIGKLGVTTREEAVAEWRRRQGRPLARLRRAFAAIPLSFGLRVAVFAGGVTAAVGIGIGVVIIRSDDDTKSDQSSSDQATPTPLAIDTSTIRTIEDRSVLEQGPSGDQWDVRLRPAARLDGVAFVTWDFPTSELLLVGRTTGRLEASITLGWQPMPLWRLSAGELLVSDNMVVPGANDGTAPVSRLLVFDIRNELALKRAIPLPNRENFTGPGATAIYLSTDERYLFYLRQSGGQPCHDFSSFASCGSIGILDLNEPVPMPTFAEMPTGCNPRITVMDAARLSVICGADAYIAQVGEPKLIPTGLLSRPREKAPSVGGNPASTRLAMFDDQGSKKGVLFSEGSYYPEGQSQPVQAIPQGNVTLAAYRMDDRRILIGYARMYGGTIEGLVVFDTRARRIVQDIPLQGVASFVPANRDVLLMLDSGAAAVLTLDPPQVLGLWQFPADRTVFVVQPTYPRVTPPP
jgi:DNA-binding CsgD family transcriptional regulator